MLVGVVCGKRCGCHHGLMPSLLFTGPFAVRPFPLRGSSGVQWLCGSQKEQIRLRARNQSFVYFTSLGNVWLCCVMAFVTLIISANLLIRGLNCVPQQGENAFARHTTHAELVIFALSLSHLFAFFPPVKPRANTLISVGGQCSLA